MDSRQQGRASGGFTKLTPDPLFVTATHLGRKRRFAEASQLIRRAKAAGQCTLADALDLQARLYAQQGLYLEADSCWREAQKADPRNPAYADALARLRKRQSGLPRLMRAVAFAGAVALVCSLVWGFTQLSGAIRDSESRTRQELLALGGSLGELRSTSASQSERTSAVVAQATSDLRSHSDEAAKATRAQVAEGFAALEPAIAAKVSELQERVDAANEASQERNGNLAASVAELGRSIAAIERGVNDRVSKAEKMLQVDMKSLATSESVQRLVVSLTEMGANMAALTKTVDELMNGLDEEGASPR